MNLTETAGIATATHSSSHGPKTDRSELRTNISVRLEKSDRNNLRRPPLSAPFSRISHFLLEELPVNKAIQVLMFLTTKPEDIPNMG